jgi:hypothetical protein
MSRSINKNRHPVALLIMWGSLALAIIAGIMLTNIYQEEVLPYVGYYSLAVGLTLLIYLSITIGIVHDRNFHIITQILGGFWIFIILGAGTAGVAVAGPQIAARYFASSPNLTWTDDQDPSTGITVSWMTTYASENMLSYGTERGSLTETAGDSSVTRFHHVALNGLIKNTTYYYKVPGFYVKEFTTAPLKTAKFNYTFTVWSDHRTNTNIMKSYTQPNIVELMAERMADIDINSSFSMFTGDLTSTASDALSWDTWFNDVSYSDWAINSSLQIAYGNHERNGDLDKSTVQAYYPYTPKPDGHYYYSFDYGVAHFIILDTYTIEHSWSQDLTDEQLAWLENDLETHQDANFTMIFMHPPPSNLAGVRTHLATLSTLYNIDVIFCGHEHYFNRQTLLGTSDTQQIIMGLGGCPNNDYADLGLECDTAFARVSVSPEELRVIVEFTNGTTLTDFSIVA